MALRRLQLSVTQDRPFSSFSLVSLAQPYAVVARSRRVPLSHRPVLTRTNFAERVAAALADPLLTNDVLDMRSPSGAFRVGVSRVCGAAGDESRRFTEDGGG
jgi:hypothetical protein